MSPSRSVRTLVLAFAALSPLTAQCGFTWLPGGVAAGPRGAVETVLPLPTGGVVAGGTFLVAGGAIANNIARWDGIAWQAMGAGSDFAVRSLARLPNGDVVAGGYFASMGGQASDRIARWNGSSWSPVGPGLNGPVECLLVLPNGDLVAGGSFVSAGGVTVNRVARWNGTAWGSFGAGIAGGTVHALARLPNGNLVAGTGFAVATGQSLYRWNGTTWTAIAGLDAVADVHRLAVLPNGNLAISGTFSIGGTPRNLAIWNGSTMQALVSPVATSELSLLAASNGDLVVGGTQTPTVASMARWNGTTWTPIAGGPPIVRSLAEDASGRIVVGAIATSTNQRGVSRYDGVGWQDLGAGPAPEVFAILRMPDGDIVVGGTFTSFAGVPANNVVRWNGTSWSALGLGVDDRVLALTAAPNGDLLVAGHFLHAGGAPAVRIARWNGQVWSTLGAGLPVAANSLAAPPSGEILAAGSSLSLRKFDGIGWTNVMAAPVAGLTAALAVLPSGDVAVAGTILGVAPAVTGLVRYANGTLSAIPGAPSAATRLLVKDDGKLLVLASGVGLREWDGTTWTTLPPINAGVFAQLPDGDLIAGGSAATLGGSTTPTAIFRLRASGWQNFGAVAHQVVGQLATSPRGELFAGGTFQVVNGAVSVGFTHAQPTCPGGLAIVGSGCSGAAGPVTLQSDHAPWVGGTFRATASGMTNNSLALQLFGLQPALLPLPGGAPGCSLFLLPIVAETLVPANGLAAGVFAVPNQPSLVGAQMRMQVAGLEFGATGLVRITSTNALELTVGAL